MPDGNQFGDVTNVEELLGVLAGAASMCWEFPERAGVFQSERASELVTHATERLSQIMGGL